MTGTDRGTPFMRVSMKMPTADSDTPTTTALRIRCRSGIDAKRQTPR